MNYESPRLIAVGKASQLIQSQIVGGNDGHPPLKNLVPVVTRLEED